MPTEGAAGTIRTGYRPKGVRAISRTTLSRLAGGAECNPCPDRLQQRDGGRLRAAPGEEPAARAVESTDGAHSIPHRGACWGSIADALGATRVDRAALA